MTIEGFLTFFLYIHGNWDIYKILESDGNGDYNFKKVLNNAK